MRSQMRHMSLRKQKASRTESKYLKTFVLIFFHSSDALKFCCHTLLTSTLHYDISPRHSNKLYHSTTCTGTASSEKTCSSKKAACIIWLSSKRTSTHWL